MPFKVYGPYKKTDITRSVRLPLALDRELERLVEAHGTTRNRELRQAITAWVEAHA